MTLIVVAGATEVFCRCNPRLGAALVEVDTGPPGAAERAVAAVRAALG